MGYIGHNFPETSFRKLISRKLNWIFTYDIHLTEAALQKGHIPKHTHSTSISLRVLGKRDRFRNTQHIDSTEGALQKRHIPKYTYITSPHCGCLEIGTPSETHAALCSICPICPTSQYNYKKMNFLEIAIAHQIEISRNFLEISK